MASLLDDLRDIERFFPKGATRTLLAQLDEGIAEINSYRPLAPDLVKKISDLTLTDRVRSSAVTEGNRLSKRETIMVLSGRVIEAGLRRDEVEVRNLARAILEMESLLSNGERPSEQLARHLHGIVLANLSPNAGRYRDGAVAITGAPYAPPLAAEIPILMRSLFEMYAEYERKMFTDGEFNHHPVVIASWLHWALARIHPFEDGNGRLARLLQDYVLLRAHYVPSTLQPEDREGKYYESLAEADDGNGRHFVEMIARNSLKTVDTYLTVIREERERRDWLSDIIQVAKERVRQSDYRRFLVIQRTSNLLRNEFALVTEQLAVQMRGIASLRFRDYKNLAFEQFQQIEREGRAKRTWFFGVEIRVGENRLRYIFWFGGHHPRPDDIVAEEEWPSKVVILVSVEDEEEYYRLLDAIEEDRVTLREIVPANSRFWRRRYNPVSKKMEWDTDVTAGAIVRQFYEEVFRRIGIV